MYPYLPPGSQQKGLSRCEREGRPNKRRPDWLIRIDSRLWRLLIGCGDHEAWLEPLTRARGASQEWLRCNKLQGRDRGSDNWPPGCNRQLCAICLSLWLLASECSTDHMSQPINVIIGRFYLFIYFKAPLSLTGCSLYTVLSAAAPWQPRCSVEDAVVHL